jgi:2-polyprenyl-6-methoxyphenol hydroxylase-like FAD-dependent oxidoreductase
VAACVLTRAGVDVLLVDARPPAGFQVGESLVPAARNILLELGLWERFLGSGHVPCYGNVAAWGSSELVEMDFIRSPYGHG